MEEETFKKRVITDKEREQLAEKLDKELDEYINSLPKRRYEDGWPEDRWEEEMEKHPFFMTKSPSAGDELSPLLEGIQQLKYDENENTPEELAGTYKEDGNFNFKCKKYRVAVVSYTEGLRQRCKDEDLNAQLYNNRAAAHFFLKNYRSCLNDCDAALKIKKPYLKAQMRAAQCLFHVNFFEDCIQRCDDMLLNSPSNKEVLELRSKALASKKLHEKRKRKEAANQRKEIANERTVLEMIQERGILIDKRGKGSISLEDIEPQSPEALHCRVHVENNTLVWPVIFFYPEYKTTDFIQEFFEDCKFEDQFKVMFETTPEWDVEKKYKPSDLHIYFEDHTSGRLCPVSSKKSLREVLCDNRYCVRGGTPTFLIFVAKSEVEQRYLNDQ